MATESETSVERRKVSRITIGLVAVAIIAVGVAGLVSVKYYQSQNTEEAKQKKLIGYLSGIIELPNSTPTVVTVADKTKLTNQTLAAKVNNQDLMFIYGDAKRIIVYRPSNEKIIDIFSFASQAQTQAQSGTTTPGATNKQN